MDYEKDGMLTANKAHILTLVVLEKRDNFLNAKEEWLKQELLGYSSKAKLKAAMQSRYSSLFYELRETLKRHVKQEYDSLQDLADSTRLAKASEIIDAYKVISVTLDQLQLTKIDTRKQYDTTDVEAENEEKGL